MRQKELKLLLVGPYPPPHGGISIHVLNALTLLSTAGIRCTVLNTERGAPRNSECIHVSGAFDFAAQLFRHAWRGWKMHVHTNGHNPKSWLVALAGGMAGRIGAGSLLTLHSGFVPEYLQQVSGWRKAVVHLACAQYDRIVCVNEELAEAVRSLKVPAERIRVLPAYLPIPPSTVRISDNMEKWLSAHSPVLVTTLFFRPEYGFDLLVGAVRKLSREFPQLGCLVLGGAEGRLEAEVHVREKGLQDRMELLGDVGHETCMALMARSTAFVRPTRQDGDSISVREAVSLGVPIVASDVGKRPPEALLFKVGDADDLARRIREAVNAPPCQREAETQIVNRFLSLYSLRREHAQ